MRHLALYGHHWRNMGRMPQDQFGFIYVITDKKSGKKYIGKKQFYLWAGPVGGYKCTDPKSEWWDEKAWKPNKWEQYTSSSIPLNKEIASRDIWEFDFECIQFCKSKLGLHIVEMTKQLECDVLNAKDDNGDFLYWNLNIAGYEFRAPHDLYEARKKAAKDADAVRNYYLKPAHCGVCGRMIEYRGKCCEKQVGGFHDLDS